MRKEIGPQEGFQLDALSTPADIAILGGAAGSGKTFVLLLEAIRNIEIEGYGGVIFRRTSPQIRNEGGLWDTSRKIYSLLKAEAKEVITSWLFPNKNSIKFNHLQYDKDVLDWQGSQICFIGFDELTHFSEYQFWYMMSRNRSTCGVTPYVRATCNPDPESWVATLVEWYIDSDTGFPIAERAGVLRYFIRISDTMVWGGSKQEVYDKVKGVDAFAAVLKEAQGAGLVISDLIKSFTFIPGTIYGNKKLLSSNPTYLGNLMALSEAEQMQLLHGNWKMSLDGMAMYEWSAINSVFDNYQTFSPFRCITCDAARFGRDFCVIFVWRGWEVVQIVVLTKSDVHDIVRAVEMERRRWGIMKFNVLVDQDGVGGGTVQMGGYKGFSGGSQPTFDRSVRAKENYENLKTQCTYRVAEENVNVGNIRITVTNENCIIDGQLGTKMKIGSKVVDIRDLIKDDLRSVKKKPRDNDGKIKMSSKDEQKVYLKGRSPDFGDNVMMRKWFDLRPKMGGVSTKQ